MKIKLPKFETYDHSKWHVWFAWYPVIVSDHIIWLEKVRRKILYAQEGYSYIMYDYLNHPSGDLK